jgi:hypothetical protein
MLDRTPVKTILSRPVYHLLVADAEGASAILDLAMQAPEGFFASAHIMFVPGRTEDQFQGALKALKPAQYYEGPSIAAALPRVRQTLATAHMGTRLYLAGTEGLIGQVMQAALEAGIDHASIQTEQRGSLARRMQCVHCKGITENVTTQPANCSHCGLLLLVRDHYSRRIAAFQGVCINAEDPTEAPRKEEIFR